MYVGNVYSIIMLFYRKFEKKFCIILKKNSQKKNYFTKLANNSPML